jgi:hypothetical protein
MEDRYDDVRRAWIARYSGIFTTQQRRADLLGRRIRDRQRCTAGARPDPRNDTVIAPLLTRRPAGLADTLELALTFTALLVAPLGWALGHLLYRWTLGFIPKRLRAVPIPALLWTAVGLGTVTAVLYRPATTTASALLAPWLIAQIPATFLAAGLCAILDGWLAVDSSRTWWPLTPTASPAELDIPLSADDLTAPGVFHTLDLDSGTQHTPGQAPPSGRGPGMAPITLALALILLGSIWLTIAVLCGTTHAWTQTLHGAGTFSAQPAQFATVNTVPLHAVSPPPEPATTTGTG